MLRYLPIAVVIACMAPVAVAGHRVACPVTAMFEPEPGDPDCTGCEDPFICTDWLFHVKEVGTNGACGPTLYSVMGKGCYQASTNCPHDCQVCAYCLESGLSAAGPEETTAAPAGDAPAKTDAAATLRLSEIYGSGYPGPRLDRNEFTFPNPVENESRSWHLVELGISGAVIPVELIEFDVGSERTGVAFEIMVPDLDLSGPPAPSVPEAGSRFVYKARLNGKKFLVMLAGCGN